MDLHTGQSIWVAQPKPVPSIPAAEIERDVRCEIAVIGGGITGALLVDRLTQEGRDVILVDSRPFASGSTAASTCLLLCETDAHTYEIEEKFGSDAARRIHLLGQSAIAQLETIANDFPQKCGFVSRTSLYFASKKAHVKMLEREFAARQRLELPVERLTAADLRHRGFSLGAHFALLSPIAAECDAYQLARSLIGRAVNRGLRAYSGTRVIGSTDRSSGTVSLSTDIGPTIHAQAAVFASGYEAHEQLDERIGSLSSTWAFATDPVDCLTGWPEHTLIWESARPYIYLRTTPDNRIIMGGLDEPYQNAHADDDKIAAKTALLADRF